MAGSGVGDGGVFGRGVFEGSICGSQFESGKRPYHKNCNCALHGFSRDATCHHRKPPKVSYPIKRSWSEGSLAVFSASSSSASNNNTKQSNPLLRTSSSSSTLNICLPPIDSSE